MFWSNQAVFVTISSCFLAFINIVVRSQFTDRYSLDDDKYARLSSLDKVPAPVYNISGGVRDQLLPVVKNINLMMSSTKKSNSLQFCSFFNNRAPQEQLALKNCTWYSKNSCCLQHEIDVSFSRVKSLIGASEDCQKYTNYLMCYVCSPDQNLFYKKERLTVCEPFCDLLYEACKFAYLKGYQIADLYSTGKEFCLSRRFLVEYRHDCFNMHDVNFEAMKFSSSSSSSPINFIHICVLIFVSTILSTGSFIGKDYFMSVGGSKFKIHQTTGRGVCILVIISIFMLSAQHTHAFKVSFDDVLNLRKELSNFFKKLEAETLKNDLYKSLLTSQVPAKKTGIEVLNDVKKTIEKFLADKRTTLKSLSVHLRNAHNITLSSQQTNSSGTANDTNTENLLKNLKLPLSMRSYRNKSMASQLIIPESFDELNQEVINFYDFTEKFDELAKNFVDQYTRSVYIASRTGLMRFYSNLTLKSPFDPRSQPWYMGVKEAPSHVIIIIDTSFTDEKDRASFNRSKKIAQLLINSLAAHQRVAVISSASRAWHNKGLLQDGNATNISECLIETSSKLSRLMKATNGNKKMLTKAVEMLTPFGGSDHKNGFMLSFELLERQKRVHRKYLDCRSVVLFVTDGDESEFSLRCSEGFYQFNENNERIFQKGSMCDYKNDELLDTIQWRQSRIPGTKAKIFTFLTKESKKWHHSFFPGKLACQNNGAMSRVYHDSDLFNQMAPYFDYIRAREYSMDPILTGPYESSIDGEPILTLSMPLLPGNNINAKKIIGVIGMDISLSAFESLIHEYHDFTSIINLNDGGAIIHPLLPKSYEGVGKWMDIPIMDLEMYEEEGDNEGTAAATATTLATANDKYYDDDYDDDNDDKHDNLIRNNNKFKKSDHDAFPYVLKNMLRKKNGSHVITRGVNIGVAMKEGYILWKPAKSAYCFYDKINDTHFGVLLKAYSQTAATGFKPTDRLFEVLDDDSTKTVYKKEHLFRDKSTQWLHTWIFSTPSIPITLDASSIVLAPSAFCHSHMSGMQYNIDKVIVQESINKRPRDDDKVREGSGESEADIDGEESEERWYDALLGKEKNCLITKEARVAIQFSKMLTYSWRQAMARDRNLRSVYMASIAGVIRHYPGVLVPENRVLRPMRYKWFLDAAMHTSSLNVINNRLPFTTSNNVITISRTVEETNSKNDGEIVMSLSDKLDGHRFNTLQHEFNFIFRSLINKHMIKVHKITRILPNCTKPTTEADKASARSAAKAAVSAATAVHHPPNDTVLTASFTLTTVTTVSGPQHTRACMTIVQRPYIDLQKLRKLNGVISGYSTKEVKENGEVIADDPCYTGVFYLTSIEGTDLLFLTLIDVNITNSDFCKNERTKSLKAFAEHMKPLCPLHEAYYATRSNSTTCPNPRFISLYCYYNRAATDHVAIKYRLLMYMVVYLSVVHAFFEHTFLFGMYTF
ncbi:hypothetical protein HELRODRAFT_175671 [Helobdella robusta]|uniref:VWFA domain-containing protein n=1 Tax=Helobdella robusta TaxID=6412 RepID=T1F9I2_HELRO|nr:hypothetical protein HELRODRAFT_175671 [Helobdella robusta]ESO00688.1 hypothetical protein HELRODRAFT_175671 [Helobdella robusta]